MNANQTRPLHDYAGTWESKATQPSCVKLDTQDTLQLQKCLDISLFQFTRGQTVSLLVTILAQLLSSYLLVQNQQDIQSLYCLYFLRMARPKTGPCFPKPPLNYPTQQISSERLHPKEALLAGVCFSCREVNTPYCVWLQVSSWWVSWWTLT